MWDISGDGTGMGALLPVLLGVSSQMWHMRISPQVWPSPCGWRGHRGNSGVLGTRKDAFGSSAGEEQRSSGCYFCFAENLQVWVGNKTLAQGQAPVALAKNPEKQPYVGD